MGDLLPTLSIVRIISGGQTGVDRGALDAALALGLPHGGWCPRGRRAEDGAIPPRYQLTETASKQYAMRTERNVVDSDGTLILARAPLAGGAELTRQFCHNYGKPWRVANPDRMEEVAATRAWLAQQKIQILNVAGPRESSSPGIASAAETFVHALLQRDG